MQEISQYIEYFKEQAANIGALTSDLYKKIIYVTAIDCLSRAVFPNEAHNKQRFVKFIDSCSGWAEKDRVSLVQLKLSLNRAGVKGTRLCAEVEKRLATWAEGAIIRSVNDPLVDEMLSLATPTERKIVERARYAELLYIYRNKLVHEFREPGYGMEISGDPTSPYYHSRTDSSGARGSWELVFSSQLFGILFKGCIQGAEALLHANRVSPYDAYEFGTLWDVR